MIMYRLYSSVWRRSIYRKRIMWNIRRSLTHLQFQIPTALLFSLSFPQKVQLYVACCVNPIFLICFRRDAPYLVPYSPTTPTLFVRLAWLSHTWVRNVVLIVSNAITYFCLFISLHFHSIHSFFVFVCFLKTWSFILYTYWFQ